MTSKVTRDEITAAVWSACDTFRGVLDASEYKDYVLLILFLKYVSDTWEHDLAEARKRYGGDAQRVRRRMERERFVIPEGATFAKLLAKRDADNLGEEIDKALAAIEDANKSKLEDVFTVSFNDRTKLGETRDRNRRLKNVLEDFARLDLSPARVSEDVLGEAYIYLIERFATEAGKKSGEFYTPRQVARLLAKMAQPEPGDRICDPACGSASLLVRVAEEIGGADYALFGQEVNGGTHALARLNMFLHGIDAAHLEWGDVLNDPKLVEGDRLMTFDVVVANPPFSLDKWGAEHAGDDRFRRFWRGVPPKSKGDYAFITHMVEIARKREGRVAVVVPHGVLFRGGAEGRIRRQLIEENLLDAVVGLPQNLFPTTSIPVALLLFDRRREAGGALEGRNNVLFIDASRDFVAGKNQNALSDEQVDTIAATLAARADVEKYARIVPAAEIADNDFNLNIPRYVDTFEEEEEIDVAEVQREIEALEGELAEVRAKMRGHLKALGVEVAE